MRICKDKWKYQFRRNCISSIPQGIAYHQFRKELHIIIAKAYLYSLTADEIQQRRAVVDDIHADAWWYTIAFAMDKKISFLGTRFFGASDRTWTCTLSGPDPKSGVSANSTTEAGI